jgi:hypothetical protein
MELIVSLLEEALRRYTTEARAQIDLASTQGRGVDAPLVQDATRSALGLVAETSTQPLKLALASGVAFTVRRGERRVDVVVGQHSNGRSFSATVDFVLRTLEAGKTMALIREHDLGVPTSWDKSVKTLATIQRKWPHAFIEIGRRELTALLATQRLLAAVQSQDLLDDAGTPIGIEVARDWLKEHAVSAFVELADRLLATGVEPTPAPAPATVSARPALVESARTVVGPLATAKPPARNAAYEPKAGPREHENDVSAHVEDLLKTLRVASVDGVARRLVDAGVEAPRGEIVQALRACAQVRWFGETLVAIQEAP